MKELGNFVEIEMVTADKEYTEFYEEEILELATTLGIDQKNRINSTYDIMIHE